MSSWWSPEFWSSLSGPAVAIFVCGAFVWLLVTERLVIGKTHRDTVARAQAAESARDTAVTALIEKNVAEEAATSILSSIRQEIAAIAKGRD